MRTIAYGVALAALCFGVSGCATVIRGTTTEFTVKSEPPEAKVATSTGFGCDSTPCTFKMPRKNAFDITVSKAGYVTQTQHIRSEVSGAGGAGMAGNIVAGGLIGMAVDGSDGAMNDLKPNPLTVTLEKAGPTQAEAAPAAHAAVAAR